MQAFQFNVSRHKAVLFAALLLGTALLPAAVSAQAEARLYAGLVNSRGYVVGAKLSASGLYMFEADTTWQLVGWKHPRVSAISCNPDNPDALFLACGNGAMRSIDGGRSWKLTTGWQVTESQDISVDPGRPEAVYLATAYGVWRSMDGGESWQESNVGLVKKYAQTIEVDRARSGRVLAGTEGGLYVSMDGARTWKLSGPADVSVLDLQQNKSVPEIWLAGTQQDGVLLSADNGRTWRLAEGPIRAASIYAVAIDPFEAKHMAAAGWQTGVFFSHDGGDTWQQVTEGLPVPNIYEIVYDANTPGKLWVATIEEGIYTTPDSGKTWNFAGLYGSVVFDLLFVDEK